MSINAVRQNLSRFVSAYTWVVKDHLVPRWKAVLTVSICGFVGALAQGAAIAFVALAVRVLQHQNHASKAIFPHAPWADELIPESRILTLVLLGILLLTISFIAAFSTYRAMLTNRQITREFHQRCSRRVFQLIASSGPLSRKLPEEFRSLNMLVMRDSTQLGRSAALLLALTVPFWRLVVVMSILFFVDPFLTSCLIPLVGLSLPWLYKSFHRVQNDARYFHEEVIFGLRERLAGVGKLVNTESSWWGRMHDPIDNVYFQTPEVNEYFQSLDKIALAQNRVQFQVALGSSLLMVMALMVTGYLATIATISWTLVVTYLLALVQVVAASKQFLGTLTSLGQLYPAVLRFQAACGTDFENQRALLAQSQSESDSKKSPIDELTFNVTTDLDHQSMSTISIRKGQSAFLIHQNPLDRISSDQWLALLRQASKTPKRTWREKMRWATNSSLPRLVSINQWWLPTASDEIRRKSIQEWIDRFQIQDAVDALADGWDTPLDLKQWNTLTPEQRSAFVLIGVFLDDPALVFIDLDIYEQLNESRQNIVHEEMSNRLIFFYASKASKLTKYTGKNGKTPNLPFDSAGVLISASGLDDQAGTLLGGSCDWFSKLDLTQLEQNLTSAAYDDMDELAA